MSKYFKTNTLTLIPVYDTETATWSAKIQGEVEDSDPYDWGNTGEKEKVYTLSQATIDALEADRVAAEAELATQEGI